MNKHKPYQDRGHMKWQSSRMMLPEHLERLSEFYSIQNNISRPILDADQQEELNYALHVYLEEHCVVEISYFGHGAIHKIAGILHSCNLISRILVVYAEGDIFRLQLSDILSIIRQ